MFQNLAHHAFYRCRGHGDGGCAREPRGIHAEYASAGIDQRAARLAGIKRHIWPQKAVNFAAAPCLPRRSQTRNDARAGRQIAQSGASEGEHKLSYACSNDLSKGHRSPGSCVLEPQNRHVSTRIAPQKARLSARLVRKSDLNFLCAAQHMTRSNDNSRPPDDSTGPNTVSSVHRNNEFARLLGNFGELV